MIAKYFAQKERFKQLNVGKHTFDKYRTTKIRFLHTLSVSDNTVGAGLKTRPTVELISYLNNYIQVTNRVYDPNEKTKNTAGLSHLIKSSHMLMRESIACAAYRLYKSLMTIHT